MLICFQPCTLHMSWTCAKSLGECDNYLRLARFLLGLFWNCSCLKPSWMLTCSLIYQEHVYFVGTFGIPALQGWHEGQIGNSLEHCFE